MWLTPERASKAEGGAVGEALRLGCAWCVERAKGSWLCHWSKSEQGGAVLGDEARVMVKSSFYGACRPW